MARDPEAVPTPAGVPPPSPPNAAVESDDSAALALREDRSRLDGYLAHERDRLRRIVTVRLDPRISARVDASDVVQETCLEAARRLDDFLRDAPMPFAVWLRFLACQKLSQFHRLHLGAGKRDAGRDLFLDDTAAPVANTATLAGSIVQASQTSPSDAAARAEEVERVRAALEELRPEERSVLVLRHFERWSNQEVARILGITESGASLRYSRAAMKLRKLLERRIPGRQ